MSCTGAVEVLTCDGDDGSVVLIGCCDGVSFYEPTIEWDFIDDYLVFAEDESGIILTPIAGPPPSPDPQGPDINPSPFIPGGDRDQGPQIVPAPFNPPDPGPTNPTIPGGPSNVIPPADY